jgi:hypothetical protein
MQTPFQFLIFLASSCKKSPRNLINSAYDGCSTGRTLSNSSMMLATKPPRPNSPTRRASVHISLASDALPKLSNITCLNSEGGSIFQIFIRVRENNYNCTELTRTLGLEFSSVVPVSDSIGLSPSTSSSSSRTSSSSKRVGSSDYSDPAIKTNFFELSGMPVNVVCPRNRVRQVTVTRSGLACTIRDPFPSRHLPSC